MNLFLEIKEKIWKPHPKIEIMVEMNDSLSTFRYVYPCSNLVKQKKLTRLCWWTSVIPNKWKAKAGWRISRPAKVTEGTCLKKQNPNQGKWDCTSKSFWCASLTRDCHNLHKGEWRTKSKKLSWLPHLHQHSLTHSVTIININPRVGEIDQW